MTVAVGWPHYAKAMAEHPTFAARDLSALRDGNLYAILPDGVRPRDPELRSNSLGMTETRGPHTFDRMDVDLPDPLRGTFGRPVPGLTHRITDRDTGLEVAPGVMGEIQVRGYSVMHEIYKREREATFEPDGFYGTGDGGWFGTDGVLRFAGRLGDIVKTGGANVAPREVEQVLTDRPDVAEAHVLGLPDPERGQILVAAVVAAEGCALEPDALRRWLRGELAAYKVPRVITLVERDALPRTDSGKVDKRRLATLLAVGEGGQDGGA